MKVGGYNKDHRLDFNINKGDNSVKFPCDRNINVSALLSFSAYLNSVWVKQSGEAYAIGCNQNGQISSTLPKDISSDTKIILYDKDGQKCKFTSAVCGNYYTLYQVAGKTSSDPSKLVYSYIDKKEIFLNLGKRSPLSLFGGSLTSAAIDTEGSIILVTKDVFNSPTSEIKPLFLPDSEKAVKIACGDTSIIALSQSGRVFEYLLNVENGSFAEIPELSDKKINEISGTHDHFLAVTENGKVFGRGNNEYQKIGMPFDIKFISKFTCIDSLQKYHVVEAFAGAANSLFKTKYGEIIACGSNFYQQIEMGNSDDIYPPKKMQLSGDGKFCISGDFISIVLVDVEPPPNTPNRKIVKFSSSTSELPPRTKTGSTDEITELRKLLEMKDKEISSLKTENTSLKKKLDESQKRINEIEKKKEQALDIIDTETMDKLKKIKSLGRGATSEVFEVIREEQLALKVYYPEIFNDDDDDEDNDEKVARNTASMRKFLLEYESINQLDHKNIIKAFGIYFGDEEHAPSILLEYCASNLKKKIKKLTNSERIRAIVDISSAMKEVHSVGIIHRDLKLENILLDEENNVKLSDFGLCTLMTVENESKTRTQMTGTLKYMAPELLNESTDYDEKVDVYAFGVVVFLILTKGEFPKIGFSDILHGKKADIPSSITHFSKELINKCWSFKASDRPSFAEIYDSLNKNESKLI